jgi:hypothetical protein
MNTVLLYREKNSEPCCFETFAREVDDLNGYLPEAYEESEGFYALFIEDEIAESIELDEDDEWSPDSIKAVLKKHGYSSREALKMFEIAYKKLEEEIDNDEDSFLSYPIAMFNELEEIIDALKESGDQNIFFFWE